MGISVSGAIVIAKYGGSWRGIKPKVAAEHGALACIIYSDPRDDGYFVNDVFPDGPDRPKDGAQRGSVMDMPLYPGDPLTPGVGATKDAKRLAISGCQDAHQDSGLADVVWRRASRCLSAMKGPLAPECLARRAAHHLSHRARSGQSPSQAGLQLGNEDALRRDRSHSGLAISRRMGDSRKSSRWMGERRGRSDGRRGCADGRDARALRIFEAGMEAQANHDLCFLGWRRARVCWVRPNGWKLTRTI